MFGILIGLLSIAVVTVWLFKRMNMPPILAYLVTGIIIGSNGLSLIHDPEEIHLIAELGIVFLLFSLGLEFSVPKLMSMRHMVFGVGSAQVLVSILIAMALALLAGFEPITAFAIGGILSLSSTAIVIKQLNEDGILNSMRGQLSVSILLFQDIAVVPLLIAIPLLAGSGDSHLGFALFMALLKGMAVFAILLAVGKWVLPGVFNAIAGEKTDELFLLTTLLVALFAAGLTYMFGLSMSLGAFLAGMMLGESQYRHQLEADIRPFRDILMGLFFVTVGMQLNTDALIANSGMLLLLLAVTLLFKAIVIFVLVKMFRFNAIDGVSTGIMLAQVGEFSFVLIALATKQQLFSEQVASLLIGVGVCSMALTPLLMDKSMVLAQKLVGLFVKEVTTPEHELQAIGKELKGHVIICGFGRVGQTVSRFLKLEAIPYIALDIDPVRITEATSAGEIVKFGNAREPEVLSAAGLANAKLIVVTLADVHKAEAIVEKIRQLSPSIRILVRTKNDDYLTQLQNAGVTEVVPETLEGSLMLVSHVLYMSGVPVPRVLKRVRTERENRYGMLHGFYPGEDSGGRQRLELLHAVSLNHDAFAIGRTIESLNLTSRRVSLAGLRRGENEIADPGEDMVLEPMDILILKGKPRSVERAERYLLQG